jgi:hypothetical protein
MHQLSQRPALQSTLRDELMKLTPPLKYSPSQEALTSTVGRQNPERQQSQANQKYHTIGTRSFRWCSFRVKRIASNFSFPFRQSRAWQGRKQATHLGQKGPIKERRTSAYTAFTFRPYRFHCKKRLQRQSLFRQIKETALSFCSSITRLPFPLTSF